MYAWKMSSGLWISIIAVWVTCGALASGYINATLQQEGIKQAPRARFARVKLIGLKVEVSSYMLFFAVSFSILLAPVAIGMIAGRPAWKSSGWTLRRKRPVANAP